jgi:predicted RNA-binding Zn ribbon-like protein
METGERFGPTRRGGPVFRWLGEPLAIDLANTVMVVRDGGEAVDLLSTPADLKRWLEGEGDRLGGYSSLAGDLAAIRELRDAVRELLTAVVDGGRPPQKAVAVLNAASEKAPAAPLLDLSAGTLVRSETPASAESGAALLGVLARGAIEFLTGPQTEKVRICRAPSCGMFFLGTRRWCCSACGNRARAARHYEKRRAARAAEQRRAAASPR